MFIANGLHVLEVQRAQVRLHPMQERLVFPLSSEQCELLVAFEGAGSLTALSQLMRRDVSVISRSLQTLAATGVIEKQNNRWTITPLGRQVSNWTRAAVATQTQILQGSLRSTTLRMPSIDERTALIVIGAQHGFDDPARGARNNLQAEHNIARLLTAWRTAKRPIYHVPHHSREPQSPLRAGTRGSEFKSEAQPQPGEEVIAKSTNSAFADTSLTSTLRDRGQSVLVIAGFTTNHCVDATARAAGDLGFSAIVVSDACVAYDRAADSGSIVKADDTHRVVMANLHREFALVVDTDAALSEPRELHDA